MDLDSFDLDPATGSPIVGLTPVATFDTTAYFFDCDPTSQSPVQIDSTVRITGKLSVSQGELRAAVVHVDPPRLEGSITSVIEVTGGHDLVFEPTGSSLPTDLFVSTVVSFGVDAGGELEAGSVIELVDCQPRAATVTLDAAGGVASVSLTSTQIEGEVSAIDLTSSELIIGGQAVAITPGALVVSVVEGSGETTLDSVTIGSTVRALGVQGCLASGIDLHATVVLIISE